MPEKGYEYPTEEALLGGYQYPEEEELLAYEYPSEEELLSPPLVPVVGGLPTEEAVIEEPGSPVLEAVAETGKDIGSALARGGLGAAEAGARVMGMVPGGGMPMMPAPLARVGAEALSQAKEAFTPTDLEGAFESPSGFALALTEAVPALALGMGSAIGVGAKLSLPMMFALEAGNQYKTLLDQGVSEDKARWMASGTGAVNALLEQVPLGRLTRLFKGGVPQGFKQALGASVGQAAAEGGTEGLQEITSYLSEAFSSEDPAQHFKDNPPSQRVLESLAVGGALGFLAGGAMIGRGAPETVELPPTTLEEVIDPQEVEVPEEAVPPPTPEEQAVEDLRLEGRREQATRIRDESPALTNLEVEAQLEELPETGPGGVPLPKPFPPDRSPLEGMSNVEIVKRALADVGIKREAPSDRAIARHLPESDMQQGHERAVDQAIEEGTDGLESGRLKAVYRKGKIDLIPSEPGAGPNLEVEAQLEELPETGPGGVPLPKAPPGEVVDPQEPPSVRSYEDVQRDIDAEETLLESRGIDSTKLIHPDNQVHGRKAVPSDYAEGWTPMEEASPALANLYRERWDIESLESEQMVAEANERLKSLISDPEERLAFARKITQADFMTALRQTEGSEAVVGLVNTVAHRLSRKLDIPQTAFTFRGDWEGTGQDPKFRLVLKSERGLAPSRETLEETQRWLRILAPESEVRVPGARAQPEIESRRLAGPRKPGPVEPEVPTVTEEKAGRAAAPGIAVASPFTLDFLPGKLTQGIQKFFHKEGLFPPDAFKRRQKASFTRQKYRRAMSRAVKDYDKEFNRARLTEGNTAAGLEELADAAYHGDQGAMAQLPDHLRKPVRRFRKLTDLMSRAMLKEGVIEPGSELAVKFKGNLGVYVRRSYQAHTEEGYTAQYAKDNHPEIWSRAHAYVRDAAGLDDVQAEVYLEELFDKGNPDNPMRMLQEGRVDKKDLSVLMQRKDVAEPIRALLGEIKSPAQNFVHSFSRMSDLVNTHRMLSDMRDIGLQQGWLATEKTPEMRFTPYPKGEARRFTPMEGVYTTPEIASEFQQLFDPTVKSKFLRWTLRQSGRAKAAKTVGGLKTHVRNVIANVPIMWANGNWSPKGSAKAFRATWQDLIGKEDIDIQRFNDRMVELGLVGQSVRSRQLRALLREAEGIDMDVMEDDGLGRLGKVMDKAAQLYGAEDDFFKVLSYLAEMPKHVRAYPNMTRTTPDGRTIPNRELEEVVSEKVRNTMPTYSNLPRAIRKLRRVPLGNFPSFAWEVMRTRVNALQIARQEIESGRQRQAAGDPGGAIEMSMGAKRMVSTLTVPFLSTGLSHLSKMFWGIDDEEDEAVRGGLPPWSENSPLIYLGEPENGVTKTIDLGYTDPFSQVVLPVWAFARNMDDPPKAFYEMTKEFLSSFADTDFALTSTLEALVNQDAQGGLFELAEGQGKTRPVTEYRPTEPEHWMERGAHIFREFLPSTVHDGRKVWEGMKGTVSPSGRKYDARQELGSIFLGGRVSTNDKRQSLMFDSWRLQGRLRKDRHAYGEAVSTMGTMYPERVLEGLENMTENRGETMVAAWEKINEGRVLGLDDDQIFEAMTQQDGSLSKSNVDLLMDGVIPLYVPEDLPEGIDEDAALAGMEAAMARLREKYAGEDIEFDIF